MPPFFDMHSHILFGVDDGAASSQEMCAMIDAAYADGTRALCLTPHFHPGLFGDNRAKSLEAFRQLCAYAKQRYPKMGLFLGNELHYSRDCLSWLDQGLCRTLKSSRYVLVDFSEHEEKRVIMDGLSRLLSAGYVPILAHPERYRSLGTSLAELKELKSNGVLLQLDAQSPLGGFGWGVKMRANAILRAGLVDFMGSDAHDLHNRPPQMSKAYALIRKKYGIAYANAIFHENALNLVRLISHQKELD